MGKRMTTEEFIEKAQKAHGDKYDYSKVRYKNNCTKVVIVCKDHGSFRQNPLNHLVGKGCYLCGRENTANKIKLTTKEFISRAEKIYNNQYDYSKVKYINGKTKIIIICKKHGAFRQTPRYHLNKHSCPKCLKEKYRRKMSIEFVKNAKKIHKNKYNYSNIEYKGTDKKIKIICRKHGEFEQKPSGHLRGKGCPKCAKIKMSNRLNLTTNKFIKIAKKVHGDEYNYSRSEYSNSIKKIIITCRKHGEFEQAPYAHMRGSGCPECGKEKNGLKMRKNISYFIKKAREVHGDFYNYREVDYKKAIEKVTIICPIHGKFKQTPHCHLRGNGCFECGKEKMIKKQTKPEQQFMREVTATHKDKYDYSKINYKNDKEKILIICPIHGEFEQTAGSHLRGAGCPECAGKLKKNKNQFIQDAIKIHGNKYNYRKTEYVNCRTKVAIICSEHGVFYQSPCKHLSGNGCPHCSNKNEGEVKNLLFRYFSSWKVVSNKRIWDSYKDYYHKRKCDFWMEKNGIKVIVEYDGEGHFKPICFCGMSLQKAKEKFKKTRYKDKLDKEFCEEHDIILHRIKYSENKEKSIIKLKNRLLKKYGIN